MSAVRFAGLAFAAFASVLCPAAASPSAAQEAALTGLVVAASDGAPVRDVLVTLDSGERTRTGRDGSFRIEGVPAGRHRVALVAAGCQVTFASIWPEAGQEVTVAFQMEYDPAVAAAAKRAATWGRLVGAEEIRRMRARDVVDVLARLFPGMVAGLPAQPGQDAHVRSRSLVSAGEALAPAVIVDGSLLGSPGVQRLADIAIADVAWMQVSRGAVGGWEIGTGGSGGLIRIQTRRGPRMAQPFADPALCEIPGWRG